MRLCAALLVLCLSLASALARADEASPQQLQAARALADAGLELYNAKNWPECFKRFKAAETIVHAPPHVQYMARCKVGMGALVEAKGLYEKLLGEELGPDANEVFVQAKAIARTELDELEARIPHVTVVVDGPPSGAAQVFMDGHAVSASDAPIAVDPGSHKVRATADGFAAAEQSFEVAEAASQEVKLVLEPNAGGVGPEPHGTDTTEPPSLVPPIILMGAGVAIIAVGIATGVVALGKSDDLAEACPVRSQCPSENQALEDDAKTFGTVSTIAFVVGGAAIGGGVLWLVLNLTGEQEESARAEPWSVTPWTDGSQIGAAVRF